MPEFDTVIRTEWSSMEPACREFAIISESKTGASQRLGV